MTKIADTIFKEFPTLKASLAVGSLAAGDLVPVYDVTASAWKMVDINDMSTDAETTAAAIASQPVMTAGAGILSGTGTVYNCTVERIGTLIITRIFIDLTGLQSVATDLDIIGDTGVSHIGQVTTAVNGVVFGGLMRCIEVPTTGADDIDLYSATEGTGAEDAAVTDLTETAIITKGGAWAIDGGTAFGAIVADQYLYLTAGEADAGVYDAGKFLIELYGIAA